jgi:outer membrane protein assembly factor BamB
VVFVILLGAGLRGCHPPRGPRDSGSDYIPPDTDTGPTAFRGGRGPETELDPMNISVVMTDKVLQENFDGTIHAFMSPDGESYLVNGMYQRGGRRYYGFQVYDVTGELLWDHIFAGSGYRTAHAAYLAGGRYIGAVACGYDENGEIQIFDHTGRSVFSRTMNGWTSLVMSERGSWLALFNQQRRTLNVFGPPRLDSAWTLRVAEGATGHFLGDGPEFVLNEPGRSRLFGAGGQVIWSVPIPGGVRWQTVTSPNGEFLAATTEDPDSGVYLLSAADGTTIWSQTLVTGGHKDMIFSPDGRHLIVYDIGQYAAIYAMDVATGEVAWRFYLKGDRTKSILTVKDLQYMARGRYIAADIVETGREDQIYVFYHYLLLLSDEGAALWISPLGSQVDVSLNAMAGLVLITTNNLMERYTVPGKNALTLVSFLEDLPPSTGP